MMKKLTERNSEYNEGSDWEERYLLGDVPWDHGRPTPAVEEALPFFGEPREILVPGCGLGYDVAALARAGHVVEGWDIAGTAIRKATSLHRDHAVSFRQRDFLREVIPAGRFDAVFEHTFLCAIGPEKWSAAVERYEHALRPGGLLFAVLFTDLEEEATPPWKIDADTAQELFAPGFEILEITRPQEALRGREGEETLWRMRKKN